MCTVLVLQKLTSQKWNLRITFQSSLLGSISSRGRTVVISYARMWLQNWNYNTKSINVLIRSNLRCGFSYIAVDIDSVLKIPVDLYCILSQHQHLIRTRAEWNRNDLRENSVLSDKISVAGQSRVGMLIRRTSVMIWRLIMNAQYSSVYCTRAGSVQLKSTLFVFWQ